jgi:invasion protein IalB
MHCLRAALMLVVAVTPAGVNAQFGKTEPPAVSRPQATSAAYADWALNCQQIRLASGEERRACEVIHTIQVQGAKDPIAQIAVGRALKNGPLSVTLLLPVNIALDKQVRVFAEEKGGAPSEFAWRKCMPGGCFADVAASAETLKRWRAGRRGRIELRNASGQDLEIPFSLAGFGFAIDALPTD